MYSIIYTNIYLSEHQKQLSITIGNMQVTKSYELIQMIETPEIILNNCFCFYINLRNKIFKQKTKLKEGVECSGNVYQYYAYVCNFCIHAIAITICIECMQNVYSARLQNTRTA